MPTNGFFWIKPLTVSHLFCQGAFFSQPRKAKASEGGMGPVIRSPRRDGASDQVTTLKHPSFGQVAFAAVGATLIGSVELLAEAGEAFLGVRGAVSVDHMFGLFKERPQKTLSFVPQIHRLQGFLGGFCHPIKSIAGKGELLASQWGGLQIGTHHSQALLPQQLDKRGLTYLSSWRNALFSRRVWRAGPSQKLLNQVGLLISILIIQFRGHVKWAPHLGAPFFPLFSWSAGRSAARNRRQVKD